MKKHRSIWLIFPLFLILSGCTNMNVNQVFYDLTHPTGTVTGVVLDSQTGKPVSYIDLKVLVGENDSYSASTLADGTFVIHPVPAGRHTLKVLQYTPRYALTKYQTQTQSVVVERNKESYIQIQLKEAERLPLRGYLRDSNNQPISGVEIKLTDLGTDQPYEQVVTDETGFFKANVYPEEHTLFYQKYYSWSEHFASTLDVNFPDENDLEIYHWIGEFDESVDYHLKSKTLTVTWPGFSIDKEVQYEIVLSRNLQGYRLPIRSITTTDLSATFELTLQSEYGIDFYAYDQENGQLLDHHAGHLYWVDLPPQSATDQVEIFLNQFQRAFNQRSIAELEEMISETYSDNRGDTKDEILQVLLPKVKQPLRLGIYHFQIEPSTDELGGLSWAMVDLEYWLGTEQNELQHSFATLTLILDNGKLQINQVELANP